MRDLALELDPDAGRRRGLEEALRQAIRLGRLAAGSTLPSTRALATDLGYSRATVVAAYEQLRTEGYLRSERGVGTTVAPVRTSEPTKARFVANRDRYEADFRPGEPDTSSFPRQRWHRSVGRVLAAASDDALGYPDPRGVPELRQSLADYLARSRDVHTSVETVSVHAGFAPTIGFLGELFSLRGVDRVAIEDPAMPFTRQLLAHSGVTPVPVPVDREGIDAERLASASVGAVIVTPANQYPLGRAMSIERRNALIAWAEANEAWIIEDDYDGEFCYDRRPSGSLQALAPDRVIYAGTASKSLIPGLRLSWLVLPRELRRDLDRLTRHRGATSSLDQLTLADFIEHGELDRHLRSVRASYRSRKRALVDEIAPVIPKLWASTDLAGLHLTTHLPPGTDVEQLVNDAHGAGIGLVSLAAHCASVELDPGLVIGFSRPADHQFPGALHRLGAFLGERF